MLITPLNLEKEPLVFDESIPAGVLDYAPDVTQAGPVTVAGRADLIVEDRGHKELVADIRLRADWYGDFTQLCARCVEPVPTPLRGSFDLIFRPHSVDANPGEHAISADETEIGYYEESGLELNDVVREQVLLSLPSRTLCKPDCKGLCPRCGQNLNQATCECNSTEQHDPRWAALAALAGTVKTRN